MLQFRLTRAPLAARFRATEPGGRGALRTYEGHGRVPGPDHSVEITHTGTVSLAKHPAGKYTTVRFRQPRKLVSDQDPKTPKVSDTLRHRSSEAQTVSN